MGVSGGGDGRGGDVAVGRDSEADGFGAPGRGRAGLGDLLSAAARLTLSPSASPPSLRVRPRRCGPGGCRGCLLIADPIGKVSSEAGWVGGFGLLGDLLVVLEFVDQDGHWVADCAFDQSDLVEQVRPSGRRRWARAVIGSGCPWKRGAAWIHWARWAAPSGSRLLSPITASSFCSQ